jgi:hypothetical protein
MTAMDEAPASFAGDRGSEKFTACSDSPQDALARDGRQDPADPLRILRLHWGLDAAWRRP